MDGDDARLVMQDLIITNWATFSTGDGLGEAFPVGLDGAQGGHAKLLTQPQVK